MLDVVLDQVDQVEGKAAPKPSLFEHAKGRQGLESWHKIPKVTADTVMFVYQALSYARIFEEAGCYRVKILFLSVQLSQDGLNQIFWIRFRNLISFGDLSKFVDLSDPIKANGPCFLS